MTKVTSSVFLISEILYSGRFEVPWHQRYYDWTEEQVRELLSDLKEALDANKTCYFLGSIMLVNPSETTPRRINDGQQRLITLSLLIAACCRRFTRRSQDQGRETLALRALFNRPDNQTSHLTDASSYQPRIEPPRNDKSKYFNIVRGYDIGTNGLLTKAWKAIDDFVGGMSRSTTVDLFDFLMNKVEVSVLDIPSDVDANAVFEALNARGKPLDHVDLIRNRLYSYFSEADDPARRETVHENLENTLVIGRRPETTQEYFRCYLQCRYGYLQKTRFYRDARTHIERAAGHSTPSDYVFALVVGLGRQDSIELFRTITSSRVSQSLDLPKVAGKRDLPVLLSELQGYKVSHPLVFALLHRTISDGKRETGRLALRSLKNLTSFVMRTAFVAPKFEPSRFEAALANCAKDVFGGSDLLSLDIMDELERNDDWSIIDDANFIRRMVDVEYRDRDRRALRYLFGINAQNQRGSDVFREDKCSVEHVLPQSSAHWEHWSGFDGVDRRDWIYRTGNMLVLPKGEDRGDAEYNHDYQTKRSAFANSSLQMARRVAQEYDVWTPNVITERSRTLGKQAAATWRFSSGKTP